MSLEDLLKRVDTDLRKLDADDLDTIEIIARNGQTGRITPFEVRALVAVYRECRALISQKEGATDAA